MNIFGTVMLVSVETRLRAGLDELCSIPGGGSRGILSLSPDRLWGTHNFPSTGYLGLLPQG
jgi:hypothetical protein